MGFFSKPANAETQEGRSRERYRRAALTGLTSAAAKGTTILASIVAVPLTFRYLGMERYGIWMTITSIVVMLGPADLGIGLGLINLVADSVGRDDIEAARRAASSAFWLLSGMAFLILAVVASVYQIVPWERVFNVRSPGAISESGPALVVFLACFAASLPIGITGCVQTGLQKGFITNQWAILGSSLSLIGLLFAIHFHAGLPTLVFVLAGSTVLAALMNGAYLFIWERPELRPDLRYFSTATARRLLHTGLMFFLLQAGLSVAYQSDNIVITQVLGAAAVSGYAIPARLFNIAGSILNTIYGAMWPAYADAKARLDTAWIRRSFFRTSILGVSISAAITLFLLVFGNRILRLWVGPQVQASAKLLTIFGIRAILNAYLQPINFLLNGLGELKQQAILTIMMAGANIVLSILFVKRFGILGAVLGTVVAEAAVLLIPMTMLLHRTLARLDGR